ncbi:MAG: hypothetical protein ACRD92_02615 [Nitrosopumilaceae archaeon]
MKYLILLAIILAMIPIQYGQAAPADSIRTTDSLGNEITPSLNALVYFQYDVANGYTNVKDFNIELFIIMDDNNEQLFYQNQQLQLNPDEWKTITWSFVPENTGNYTSKIIINGISHSYGFIINNYARDDEVSLEVRPVKVKFGDDITIHANLPSYEKPDDLRYYIDVFDLEGRKVDSTLWFARTDFNYTMRTEHPAFNITRAGDYTIYVERALNIERTGEIVKTTSFTIITNPPPLKQVDRGISPANVICNDDLGLILKTKDGSPACAKYETAVKLVSRGWTDSLWIGGPGEEVPHPQAVKPFDNTLVMNVEYPDGNYTDFAISYTITEGQIEKAFADVSAKSLTILIKTTANGTLIVDLPRALIDPKINNQDSQFIIVEDGQEVDYRQIKTTSTDRILSIPFSYGISKIEIIAPEPI